MCILVCQGSKRNLQDLLCREFSQVFLFLITCGGCRLAKWPSHDSKSSASCQRSFYFSFERLTTGYSDVVHRPTALAPPWSLFRNVKSQPPSQACGAQSCMCTRSPGDLSPPKRAGSTALTHQATDAIDSGIWQVLLSRLMITGCRRSWAPTVTTGLALRGEDTRF